MTVTVLHMQIGWISWINHKSLNKKIFIVILFTNKIVENGIINFWKNIKWDKPNSQRH